MLKLIRSVPRTPVPGSESSDSRHRTAAPDTLLGLSDGSGGKLEPSGGVYAQGVGCQTDRRAPAVALFCQFANGARTSPLVTNCPDEASRTASNPPWVCLIIRQFGGGPECLGGCEPSRMISNYAILSSKIRRYASATGEAGRLWPHFQHWVNCTSTRSPQFGHVHVARGCSATDSSALARSVCR